MTHTSRTIQRSKFAVRRIVSVLTLGMLGLVGSAYTGAVSAQTQDVLPEKIAAEEAKVSYVLPEQKLTYEIIAFQIISDLAFSRGDLSTAYQGYLRLAQKTRDPRYAERAYVVAAMANDVSAALTSAQLLKNLAPNATLGNALMEQMALAKILRKSETGELQAAYQNTQNFLHQHPKHEVALTLMADLAGKLGYADEQLNAFEQLYRLTPNDPEAMNNLGYHLIEHNIRLNEAEKLIQRALKIAPNAPHIMDSAAWLAYRQGKLPQAVKLIRGAVAGSASPDIQLHMAEILWVSGQDAERAEARRLLSQLKSTLTPKDSALLKQLNATVQRLGIELTAP